nr:hypothetical protein [uncultured Brevundimonas sp.]
MTDVYGTALTTIRAGAPGLSDATCEVIARSIARKLKAPVPAAAAGQMSSGVRELLDYIGWALENDAAINPDHVVALTDAVRDACREPEWQSEAFAFLYGLIGGAPATAASVIRLKPEVRARLHRAIYERRPREESYDAMMARLLPNGLPDEVEQ